jgi:hypothetical protein
VRHKIAPEAAIGRFEPIRGVHQNAL